jgi:hypothetical protein
MRACFHSCAGPLTCPTTFHLSSVHFLEHWWRCSSPGTWADMLGFGIKVYCILVVYWSALDTLCGYVYVCFHGGLFNRFSSHKINKIKIKLAALCLCVCLSLFKETGGLHSVRRSRVPTSMIYYDESGGFFFGPFEKSQGNHWLTDKRSSNTTFLFAVNVREGENSDPNLNFGILLEWSQKPTLNEAHCHWQFQSGGKEH